MFPNKKQINIGYRNLIRLGLTVLFGRIDKQGELEDEMHDLLLNEANRLSDIANSQEFIIAKSIYLYFDVPPNFFEMTEVTEFFDLLGQIEFRMDNIIDFEQKLNESLGTSDEDQQRRNRHLHQKPALAGLHAHTNRHSYRYNLLQTQHLLLVPPAFHTKCGLH